MATETFLFPVIYKGTPKSEHAAKTITVPGSPDPVVFRFGPDFDLPYAYVTETQGRYLRRIAPNLFDFPNGLHSKTDTDDLVARIEMLEARLARLEAGGDVKATRTRKASAEPPALAFAGTDA